MGRLILAFCLLVFTSRAQSQCGSCGSRLDGVLQRYTSPCYPSPYKSNMACKDNITIAEDTNYTQIVITSFDTEAWHDYLKLDGATNFVIFADVIQNEIRVTGYPSGNITTEFVSDSGVEKEGFNATYEEISENELVIQYAGYKNTSNVQVLDSPLYITSVDNAVGDSALDIILMNIPNDTTKPIQSWTEYIDLMFNSTPIDVSEVSPGKINVSWELIGGTDEYVITVEDSKGVEKNKTTVDGTTSNLLIDSLPYGSILNVTVKAEDKWNAGSEMTASVTTGVINPTGFKVVSAGETGMTLTWDEVDGATEYIISASDPSSGGNQSSSKPPLTYSGLSAGNEYDISLFTKFEDGESGPVIIKHVTISLPIKNLDTTEIRTTGFNVTWDSARAAEKYRVVLVQSRRIIKDFNESKTEYVFDTLTPGLEYQVRIKAVNKAGEGRTVSAWFTTEILPDDAKLWTSDIKSREFVVNWDEIPGAQNFTLRLIPTVSGEGRNFTNLGPSVRKQKINNTLPGSKYNISLEVAGENKIDFLRNETTTETDEMKLNATDITSDGFKLYWIALEGAVSYKVKANSSSPEYTTTGTSYVFSGLESGFNYSVEAFAEFSSENSLIASITVPTAPTAVTNVVIILPTNVGIDWFAPTWNSPNGATSYDVEVTSDSGVMENFTDVRSGQKLTGIIPGMLHTAKIYALNGKSRSVGADLSFTTDLGSVLLSIVEISRNHFTLKWEKVEGADGYECSCSHKQGSENTTEFSKKIEGLQAEKEYTCSVTTFSKYKKGKSVSRTNTTARDECESSPCQNEGLCTATDGGHNCKCATGFTGKDCSEEIDYCKDNCGANAGCTNHPKEQSYTCYCPTGYSGDPKVGCVAFCNAQTIKGFKFLIAYAGETTYSDQKCDGVDGKEGRPKASILCKLGSDGAVYDNNTFNSVPCEKKVKDLGLNNANASSTADVEKQTKDLELLTTNTEVSKQDTEDIANYMERVSDEGKKSKDGISEATLRGFVNTASNLIDQSDYFTPQKTDDNEVSQRPDTPEEKNVKKKILKNLNSLAEQVQIPENATEITITSVAMVVKVLVRESKADPASFDPVIIDDKNDTDTGSKTFNPVKIEIPSGAINKADDEQKNIGGNKTRISFFLHRDATLFPINDNNRKPEMIVAANLGTKNPITNLQESDRIKYFYRNTTTTLGAKPISGDKFKTRIHKFTCEYWDEKAGDWSTKGCCAVAPNLTECKCNHLTNFAVLVTRTTLPAMVPLEIFSNVGLALSMVGLVLTIIIHCLNEDIRKRGPTRIMLHICGNLIVSYALFMAGIDKISDKTACTVITAFLQYFFLTSWCWMAVYASDMYRALVLVFNGSKSHYMTKCGLFGYGVPLLITAINIGVAVGYFDQQIDGHICPNANVEDIELMKSKFPMESAYVAPHLCWLHQYSLIFGFLLPIGLIILFNIFVYGMVMKTILGRAKTVQSSMKKTDWKDNFMISVTVTASTGLTWIFGYLMLLSEDQTYLTVMSWIFAIFNTLQGVLIFFATCVRNENMRKIWWVPIRHWFARCAMRLSSSRNEYNIDSDTGTSTYFSTGSTSQTKDTTLSATKIKELTSETNL